MPDLARRRRCAWLRGWLRSRIWPRLTEMPASSRSDGGPSPCPSGKQIGGEFRESVSFIVNCVARAPPGNVRNGELARLSGSLSYRPCFDSLFDKIAHHRVGAERISTVKLAGEAAQTCSPQSRARRPRCGKTQVEGAGDRADLHGPLMLQKAGSGWKMSADFSTARSRKA